MAMERIQTAISKAREARKTQGDLAADLVRDEDAGAPPLAVAPAATLAASLAPSEADAADAAWAGLMEFRPNVKHLERSRVVSLTGGAASAPFDSLRTRLLHLMRDKGWKRIAVTSPGPGCGKSTVALNLALSLARLADLRTVLIDADMRRPAMARLLGASAQHQIADVLAGKAKAQANLLRIGANLAVGTNRMPVAQTAELLQSPVISEALDRIEAEFQPDLMVFDLPPLQVSDDTIAAMGLVDCVLIVAAAGTTTVPEIDRCERDLAARTNVAGVILNKARYLEKTEGYGYGYY
jgi:Mrp family chromosome partitioning ATPase